MFENYSQIELIEKITSYVSSLDYREDAFPYFSKKRDEYYDTIKSSVVPYTDVDLEEYSILWKDSGLKLLWNFYREDESLYVAYYDFETSQYTTCSSLDIPLNVLCKALEYIVKDRENLKYEGYAREILVDYLCDKEAIIKDLRSRGMEKTEAITLVDRIWPDRYKICAYSWIECNDMNRNSVTDKLMKCGMAKDEATALVDEALNKMDSADLKDIMDLVKDLWPWVLIGAVCIITFIIDPHFLLRPQPILIGVFALIWIIAEFVTYLKKKIKWR